MAPSPRQPCRVLPLPSVSLTQGVAGCPWLLLHSVSLIGCQPVTAHLVCGTVGPGKGMVGSCGRQLGSSCQAAAPFPCKRGVSWRCLNGLLAMARVQPKDMGLPVHAYTAKDEVREDGTQKSQRVFVNLPTEVGATEAEDIGEFQGCVCGFFFFVLSSFFLMGGGGGGQGKKE